MTALSNTLAIVAAAATALLPGAGLAQSTPKNAAKHDVAVWADAVSNAFTTGYWEGQMKELDGPAKW